MFLLRRLNNTVALFIITLCLMGIGLVMVYSSSAALTVKSPKQKSIIPGPDITPTLVSMYHSTYFVERQLFWTIIGIGLIFLFYTLKHDLFYKLSIWMLIGSMVLLTLVFVPGLGININGATRWLQLPLGLRIQPSELARVSLLLFIATQISRLQPEGVKSLLRVLIFLILPLGIVSLLIIREPDFGGTVVLCFLAFTLMFIGGVRVKHLLLICLIGVILVIPLALTSKYVIARIWGFISPVESGEHVNYQIRQSLIAFGSGGMFGRGLGMSAQKYHFLSEAHTDFIFSIIGEEMGFVGTLGVILLFTTLLLVGLRVCWEAVDFRSSILAAGMVLMITVPAIINMLVTVKLAPAKGLALPFISYGGSSLIANCIAIGVLMNIARLREIVPRT